MATLQQAQRANLTTGCLEKFDAARDYFPNKAAIEDVANVTIEYRRSYKEHERMRSISTMKGDIASPTCCGCSGASSNTTPASAARYVR